MGGSRSVAYGTHRDLEVFLGPSGFLEAWGATAKKPAHVPETSGFFGLSTPGFQTKLLAKNPLRDPFDIIPQARKIEQQWEDLWESIFVDLCSIFQAGSVGNGPGPNFGRKPAQNQPKPKLKNKDLWGPLGKDPWMSPRPINS